MPTEHWSNRIGQPAGPDSVSSRGWGGLMTPDDWAFSRRPMRLSTLMTQGHQQLTADGSHSIDRNDSNSIITHLPSSHAGSKSTRPQCESKTCGSSVVRGLLCI